MRSDREWLVGLNGIHERIVRDAHIGNRVRCDVCKREETVNPAECLRRGWPTCCHGHTMTLLPASEEQANAK